MIQNSASRFSVDEFVASLQNLDRVIETEKLPLKRALESNRFIRASLDVFRDKETQGIWKLETADNGDQFIVRSNEYDEVTQGDWSAAVNRTATSITLFYKTAAITSFDNDVYHFPPEKAKEFAEFIVTKASTNKDGFRQKLVATLSTPERISLQKRFAAFRG